MKVFHCDHCGHLLFFENTHCVRCGQLVAYLPDLATLGSLDPNNDETGDEAGTWRSPLEAARNSSYRLCRNYAVEQVCNWAIPGDDPHPLCISCRLTRVIPDLAAGDYRQAWYRLEVAKRRLIFTLLRLRLPIVSRDDDPAGGLAFEFKADGPNGDAVLTGTCGRPHHDQRRGGRRCRKGAAADVAARAVSHARRALPARERSLLLGSADRRQRPARRISPRVRRRTGRLWRGLEQLLRSGSHRRLAGPIHQRVRERSSSRRLGRDVVALPPHGRHARDRRRLRDLAPAAALRRAVAQPRVAVRRRA